MKELLVMERKGKIEDLDRSFDIQFWQAQGDAAKFDAAWELVTTAWELKGRNLHELRLQRTVEHFQPLISREDLIKTKLASGRPQDLIDAEALSQES